MGAGFFRRAGGVNPLVTLQSLWMLPIYTRNLPGFLLHCITNVKSLRTAHKLSEKQFLVTAIRMNQPC